MEQQEIPDGSGDVAVTWPAELAAALARARIEVDLDVLAANLEAVRRFVRPGTRILAVVKGDGYGLGAEMAARTLVAAGADGLGTDTLEAALRLRRAGITAPILVFQPVDPGLAHHWVREGLTATVHDETALRRLAQAAESARAGQAARAGSPPGPCAVHLEVDMGFGRGGFHPDRVAAALAEAQSLPGIRVEGLFAHFPTAARPGLALRLLDRFLRLVQRLEQQGLRPPLVHCAESHLLVLASHAQLDMVRVGNLLYGYAPRAARRAGLAVRPPSRLVVRVGAVRRAASLDPGYRGGWARPGAPVAVLPVGLADGLRPVREARFWSDRLVILARRLLGALGASRVLGAAGLPPGPRLRVGGREVPLRGEFMMNHCLLDATGLDLEPGQEVELVVGRLTAAAHLPVVYLRGGRPVAVAWPQRQVVELVAAPLAFPAGPANGTDGTAPDSLAHAGLPAGHLAEVPLPAAEVPGGAGGDAGAGPVPAAVPGPVACAVQDPVAGPVPAPVRAPAGPVAARRGPVRPDEETVE